jgi:uncharacterized protein
MYYIPGYIKIQEVENKIILVNQYTNASVSLETKYKEELKKIINNGSEDTSTELEIFLNKYKFLLDDKNFVKEFKSYFEDNNKFLRFILMPTEKCNFRCTYCYEQHDNGEQNLDYQAIVEFLKEKVNERDWKGINISWFGGEPLLKLDEINKFHQQIQQLISQKDIKTSIVTNAYTLNENAISILEKANVMYYQITVDGNAQDRLRVLKNGKPTFDVIMNNLKTLKNHEFINCVIRVNVSDTSDDNYHFYEVLYSMIGNDARFIVDVHKVFESDLFKLDSYEKVNEMYQRNIENIKQFGFNLLNSNNNLIQCYGARKNTYTFRTNQSIVKCTVSLNAPWNQIGNITNHKVVLNGSNNTYCLEEERIKSCMRCKNIFKCKSFSCPKNMYEKRNCKAEKFTIDNEE